MSGSCLGVLGTGPGMVLPRSGFMAGIRKEIITSNNASEEIITRNTPSEERKYTTKHGTVATMNVADIGKKSDPIPDNEPEPGSACLACTGGYRGESLGSFYCSFGFTNCLAVVLIQLIALNKSPGIPLGGGSEVIID